MATFVKMSDVKNNTRAGMTDTTGQSKGLEDILDQIQRSAGLNPVHLVNSCDDATPLTDNWTESTTGTFDASAGTNNRATATNTLALTATAACDNTQYVENRYIDAGSKPALNAYDVRGMDWTDSNYVGFWLYGGTGFDTALRQTCSSPLKEGRCLSVGAYHPEYPERPAESQGCQRYRYSLGSGHPLPDRV